MVEIDLDKDIDIINSIIKYDMLDTSGELIGSGSCGKVYRVLSDYNVKVYYKLKDETENQHIQDEIILNDLKGSTFYPKVYYSVPNKYVIKEHIEGKTFEEMSIGVFKEGSDFDLIKFYHSLPAQLESLYDFTLNRGYYPIDLEDENILIREDGTICIIDVGLFEKFDLVDKKSPYYKSKTKHNEILKRVKRDTIKEIVDSILTRIYFIYIQKGYNSMEIINLIKKERCL